jgi:hypothetical protein
VFAQEKTAHATRVSSPIVIDGNLNEAEWQLCDSVSDFTQYVPVYKVKPSQKTVVRIAYDDNAIYIGAMMYDSAPDSILKQMGSRDDDLNADRFAIGFDTYNMQTDAYVFMVYASGVQYDYRQTDVTYNAVWQSAVKITKQGWSCEMKINYSAIRFPRMKEQKWGMQFSRGIRRNRETDQWSLETKSQANVLINWGKLEGIKDVNPSLRLSLTPFISLYGDHYPYNEKGKSNLSSSFSGGLDLKYGINESYTLDVTLLPDFSQVQSDYQVKNISAFETVYQEYRPFFTEAIDLFKEGDLFYTRRIGRTPQLFDHAEDSVPPGGTLRKNPAQAKLINAIKFSGRNKNGTAIGIFNAVTNSSYATIKDSLGNERKILTEPLTNYNIFVFDQILKHNSKIYFVNTNVMRSKKSDDANVSLLGVILNDKKNIFQFTGSGALSQKYHKADTSANIFSNTLGYKYALMFGKVSGKFQFNVYRNEMNNTWDDNDLGLTLQNNRTTTGTYFSYTIYEPFWKFRNMNTNCNMYYIENFLTKKIEEFQIGLSNNFTTNKYLTVWENISISPLHVNNFVETRTPGRYFVVDKWWYCNVGISSDYRKLFALDMNFEYWQDIQGDGLYYGLSTSPIFRLSDKFLLNITNAYSESDNDVGYADIDEQKNITFGKRDITTVENTISARYMFKNNLSLSLIARHYWSKGRYSEFYKLSSDGMLITDPQYNPGNAYDFNFNAFNIDLMFYWEFAPGSSLNITYKNNISKDDIVVNPSYFSNFGKIFGEKQLNSLSVKVLYYLDYQNVKKLIKRKKKSA